MYDIIIFGGGLAGMTIAHEVIKRGLKVLLVEKDTDFGGMVRSNIEHNSIPSEHSWRGYAPFYKNSFQIMKEIPSPAAASDSTVFDNLGIPIDFHILYDDPKGYKPDLTIMDKLILIYLGMLYLESDERRHFYYSYKVEPYLKEHLSSSGYDWIINFTAGPGYGMHKSDVSMGHLLHFMIISRIHKERHTHTHDNDIGTYVHRSDDRYDPWHVMNGPTSDVWIEPWVNYLQGKGVDFMNNTELVKLNYETNTISSAEVNNQGSKKLLRATNYVVATNPYNTVNIFKNSNMNDLYNTFKLVTNNTTSKQISFRLGLDMDITYPVDNIAFVMNDSEFNITWYPQEKHWKTKPPIKSLWSGTIIDFETPGKLYNKSAEFLTKEELKEEIIHQLLRSKSFQRLIHDNNGFYLTKDDISYSEIWYEWEFSNGKQEQVNKKWVNNTYNEQFRPSQGTDYTNMFLSGAHTKTSINIWSMEGAIESGKITANLILDKLNERPIRYYKHEDPWLILAIQRLDNILYNANLPNISILLLLLCAIMITRIVYYIYKNKKKLRISALKKYI